MHKVYIEFEDDIYAAITIGKKVADELGFSKIDETKLVVSIMELTRNIISYAGKGELIVRPILNGIEIIALDKGPGILNLDKILTNEFKSHTGLGLGLSGVKRLMDEFEIFTSKEGTRIRAVKWLNERRQVYERTKK